jgi:hypothetical protein
MRLHPRYWLLLAVCVFSLVLQYGCAFGTREVLLKNSTLKEEKAAAKDSAKVIGFKGFRDHRQDANIGHVQNTWGMHTAEVVAKNSVPEWVNREIALGLAQEGFRVISADTPAVVSRLSLSGELLKVYTTAYSSYVGEVTIQAKFTDSNRTLVEKKYTGHFNSGANWAASSQMFGETLEKALHDAVAQIAGDADSLYRQPALPVPQEPVVKAAAVSDTAKAAHDAVRKTAPEEFQGKCSEKSGGVTVIRGKRSSSAVRDKFSEVCLGARSLYDERVEINRYLGGRVCMHVSIAPDGKVGDIRIVDNTLNDPPVEKKLLDDFSKVTFSRYPADSAGSELLYTVIFSPSGHDAVKIVLALICSAVGIVFLIINLNNVNSVHY